MNAEHNYMVQRYEEMKSISKQQGYFTEAQWDEFLSLEVTLMKLGYDIQVAFYSED